MKRKLLSFLVLLITFFSFLIDVNAASLSISTNTNSVVTGGSVTVTIKANGLIGKFSITSSNGNVLSGGTSSVWLENETKTYKFSAKSIGSGTITVKALDVSDTSGNSFSGSKSVTINVVKPREKSTNNNLKSLSIDGYELSPTFNKNTLEYTVNLESSVEKIKINATKEDGYASLSGTGEKEVQEGDNKFEITVTSETGVSKIYTVNAVVKDSNPIVKEINGKSYTIIKRASALTKPESFDETTVTINETEIPAFYNEVTKITLVGMKDETGTIYLYRYDSTTDSYQKYESLTSTSKTIIFENSDEVIANYEKTTVTINEVEYNVYQNNLNKDYVLIYGIDLVTAEKNWYLYNVKEQTIQSYMSDIIDNMQNDFDKKLEEYKIVLLGMAGLSLLLLLIIIIQIVFKNKMKKKLLQRLQTKKETIEPISKEVKSETKLEIKEKKQEETKDNKETDKSEEKIVVNKQPQKDIKKKKKSTK